MRIMLLFIVIALCTVSVSGIGLGWRGRYRPGSFGRDVNQGFGSGYPLFSQQIGYYHPVRKYSGYSYNFYGPK